MNGFLFDTSAFIWSLLDDPRMNEDVRSRLRGAPRHVSQVCAIEIAIKLSARKLGIPSSFGRDFAEAFRSACKDLEADLLRIDLIDIERLSRLPFIHRDPFDRIIICQALSNGLTVVTGDRAFAAYAGLDVLEI